MCVWSKANFEVLSSVQAHNDAIRSLCWVDNEEKVASASNDKLIKVWTIPEERGILPQIFTVRSAVTKSGFTSITTSTGGSVLVATEFSRLVSLWNILDDRDDSGEVVGRGTGTGGGGGGLPLGSMPLSSFAFNVAISADRGRIAATSTDGKIVIAKVQPRFPLLLFSGSKITCLRKNHPSSFNPTATISLRIFSDGQLFYKTDSAAASANTKISWTPLFKFTSEKCEIKVVSNCEFLIDQAEETYTFTLTNSLDAYVWKEWIEVASSRSSLSYPQVNPELTRRRYRFDLYQSIFFQRRKEQIVPKDVVSLIGFYLLRQLI